ncbi:phy-2, partial [Pristionchus pacificus]
FQMKLLLIALILPLVGADLFTAIADMTKMLGSEADVSVEIDRYIASEQERLERLKRFAEEYSSRNAEAADVGPEFVTNPINAYLLIKRLTSEWGEVEKIMKQNEAPLFLKNITQRRIENDIKFPKEEDLSGAATALLRLQDTYQLDTHDLAQGKILSDKVAEEMTAHDCFEVGRSAYNNRDYYHTLMWMQEAIVKLEKEEPQSVEEAEILEYLAYSLYQQGNVRRALFLTKRLVEIAPNHPRAKGNVKWYEDMLDGKEMEGEIPAVINKRTDNDGIPERDAYEALCRGEVEPIDPAEQKKLYCYLKRDRPFLKLAPIKVEILRHDPLAVLFKEIISEHEISVVKDLATPRLRRATVQNSVTGELETASYRISKSAWLKGEEHPVIERINQRIDLMTNLEMETAEELQIANYGLGGHYDPHYDFARKEEKNAFKSLGTGNRIATVLFYMSQPERGGATVFNTLGTAVFPTKLDALFWYNLKRNGEGDLRTRHAACPVLLGVKWVSNKWIHEKGQEFRRPCGLTEDAYEHYVGDLEHNE